MNTEEPLFAPDEFSNEVIEDPREERGGIESTAKGRNEALFAKVKANMIKRIFDNADAADRPRMNILLFGPPGTGKTEYVKYLGKRLGRKVTALTCSNLFSCWVGETEQNIAKAFRQAEADHSILFFDEIDSFLQDRSSASQSWRPVARVSSWRRALKLARYFGRR